MALRWQCFLILLVLALGGGPAVAASARENAAYAAAASAFQDEMWGRAETEFAAFAAKYPKSDHLAEAVLMQAEAQLKQGKFAQAITLLTAREARSGRFADEYIYWRGEAQFQLPDYAAAAATFSRLVRDFPGSPLRLQALVEAAAARAKLGQWPAVDALLAETNSVFRHAAEADAANELVVRGRLLQAEAQLAQGNFGGALAALRLLERQTLKPELDWQRMYVLSRVKLASGDAAGALDATTNLLRLAELVGRDDFRAESVALRAGVLEQLGQMGDSMASYRENLKTNAPVERQRQAILKIAALATSQNRFAEAEDSLELFLAQFTNSPTADLALLTLGELHLKDYLASRPAPAATNHLFKAQARFKRFLETYANPPSAALAGRAQLDRGWCFWEAGRTNQSLEAFRDAARRLAPSANLPPSEDLAVARFKIGDLLFAQGDYAGALQNYRAVLNDFTNLPAVGQDLGDHALYQSLRASLELKDLADASSAMSQILERYPGTPLAQSSVLFMGEGLEDAHRPDAARTLFEKFEKVSPDSPLRPQVALAIAHSYEQEANWDAAIGQYDRWLGRFPDDPLQAQVNYMRARANFQAGNETNAYVQFTNFIAQYPASDLAPVAQLWVADHFFRAGDYASAEKNYQLVFQKWPASTNAYPACMMAGRAAMARLGYSDAIRYFTRLTSDTNCPSALNAQALAAYGSALMLEDPSDTNRPLANFEEAIRVFKTICQQYPTNEPAALAWGEIGECYLQMATEDPKAYEAATNAYAQVINSPYAGIAARSQAAVGVGLVFEKRAAFGTSDQQIVLLHLALQNYLDVLYQKNLREGETADPFWLKKAGLQAAAVAETLQEWEQAVNLYKRLEELIPSLKDSLDKKIARAQGHLTAGKN